MFDCMKGEVLKELSGYELVIPPTNSNYIVLKDKDGTQALYCYYSESFLIKPGVFTEIFAPDYNQYSKVKYNGSYLYYDFVNKTISEDLVSWRDFNKFCLGKTNNCVV